MRCLYVDWQPGRIGVVNHLGELLEAVASPRTHHGSSKMGEIEAIELAIPWAQNYNEITVILSDCLNSVKLISSGKQDPNPKAPFGEEGIKRAVKIRKDLQLRGQRRFSHVVAWVPRHSNLADRPLREATI